jgi:hypothetical protein
MEEPAPAPSEVKDAVTGQRGSAEPKTSVAEDVMQRKGVYGRFADKWFSRKGWSADNRRLQGLSSEENLAKNVPQNVDSVMATEEEQPKSQSKPDAIPTDDKNIEEPVSPEAIPKALSGEKDATTVALLPKILQTTKMYFSSGNFFFSYDYDISHGIGQQQPSTSVPLFKQFDPLVRPTSTVRSTTANHDSSSGTSTSSPRSSKPASIRSSYPSSRASSANGPSPSRARIPSRAA